MAKRTEKKNSVKGKGKSVSYNANLGSFGISFSVGSTKEKKKKTKINTAEQELVSSYSDDLLKADYLVWHEVKSKIDTSEVKETKVSGITGETNGFDGNLVSENVCEFQPIDIDSLDEYLTYPEVDESESLDSGQNETLSDNICEIEAAEISEQDIESELPDETASLVQNEEVSDSVTPEECFAEPEENTEISIDVKEDETSEPETVEQQDEIEEICVDLGTEQTIDADESSFGEIEELADAICETETTELVSADETEIVLNDSEIEHEKEEMTDSDESEDVSDEQNNTSYTNKSKIDELFAELCKLATDDEDEDEQALTLETEEDNFGDEDVDEIISESSDYIKTETAKPEESEVQGNSDLLREPEAQQEAEILEVFEELEMPGESETPEEVEAPEGSELSDEPGEPDVQQKLEVPDASEETKASKELEVVDESAELGQTETDSDVMDDILSLAEQYRDNRPGQQDEGEELEDDISILKSILQSDDFAQKHNDEPVIIQETPEVFEESKVPPNTKRIKIIATLVVIAAIIFARVGIHRLIERKQHSAKPYVVEKVYCDGNFAEDGFLTFYVMLEEDDLKSGSAYYCVTDTSEAPPMDSDLWEMVDGNAFSVPLEEGHSYIYIADENGQLTNDADSLKKLSGILYAAFPEETRYITVGEETEYIFTVVALGDVNENNVRLEVSDSKKVLTSGNTVVGVKSCEVTLQGWVDGNAAGTSTLIVTVSLVP